MTKKLSVRMYGKEVGILEQTPAGKMSFVYGSGVTSAISLGMPIREEPYDAVRCEAFFGGLLPEGEGARKAIGQRYGISPNNSFALLKAIGYDCAGAISFHQIDEPIIPQQSVPLRGKIVSENELYEHILSLPKKPLFMDFEGLRLSLAGAHDKAAVCIIDGQIALPSDGCPTTHILKPSVPHFENIVGNEYLCLELAAQSGLTVPHKEIRHIKDISFLLIERYDRRIQNGYVERIHQEDFCQASGIVAVNKYQNEGGPGFRACFELLQHTIQPAISRNQLMAGIVFNFLIGNMDAHGKNFSLLHNGINQIYFAPFYDLVCTQVYPDLTTKMAMKIGSKYRSTEVLPRHWQQLCEEVGYSYPALKQLIKKQSDLMLNSLTTNRFFFEEYTNNPQMIEKVSKTIEKNVHATLKSLDILLA